MSEVLIAFPIEPEPKPCGCGRSATGFCTGLHALTDNEWDARVFDESFNEHKQSDN